MGREKRETQRIKIACHASLVIGRTRLTHNLAPLASREGIQHRLGLRLLRHVKRARLAKPRPPPLLLVSAAFLESIPLIMSRVHVKRARLVRPRPLPLLLVSAAFLESILWQVTAPARSAPEERILLAMSRVLA